MAIYQRITINVSAEDDKLIKQAAKEGGYKSVSAFCRDKILNDTSVNQQLNRVTIEDKLDKVNDTQKQCTQALSTLLDKYQYNSEFFNLFLYRFLVNAAGDEVAKKAWEETKNEMK